VRRLGRAGTHSPPYPGRRPGGRAAPTWRFFFFPTRPHPGRRVCAGTGLGPTRLPLLSLPFCRLAVLFPRLTSPCTAHGNTTPMPTPSVVPSSGSFHYSLNYASLFWTLLNNFGEPSAHYYQTRHAFLQKFMQRAVTFYSMGVRYLPLHLTGDCHFIHFARSTTHRTPALPRRWVPGSGRGRDRVRWRYDRMPPYFDAPVARNAQRAVVPPDGCPSPAANPARRRINARHLNLGGARST